MPGAPPMASMGRPMSLYSSAMRPFAYSTLFVCASLTATLTASETASVPCASSSSVTVTEIGTCAPEMVTVTPPLAEVASTSVLVSSSWSSFTFTPT
eukprot:scaffold93126_cov64-Phaeocystis_antarctica.AAC.2